MTNYFNINDPEANQILQWSDLESKFINVTPSASILNIDVLGVSLNRLTTSPSVIKNISSEGVINVKGIKAGNNVTISESDNNIVINAIQNSNASSLNGLSSDKFLQKSNYLSNLDYELLRDNLDVYTTSESHDQFMETNASNVPDEDNTYDLGSNGRRYSDVYAYTFHGTATNASISQTLAKNNANEGQVLTWTSGAWKPETPTIGDLNSLSNVEVSTPSNEFVLSYNEGLERWEAVDVNDLVSISTGGSNGTEYTFRNIGSGKGIYASNSANTVSFRGLKEGNGISIDYESGGSTILVSIDTSTIDNFPNSTDDLSEGSSNLYYKKSRLINDLSSLDVNDLPEIEIDTLKEDSFLVWGNGKIHNIERPHILGDIDTTTAAVESVVSWNGSEYELRIIPPSVQDINELSDVNLTSIEEGQMLVYRSGMFLNESVSFEDNDTLGDVDTSTASVDDIVSWDGSKYVLRTPTEDIGMTLDDLDTSTAFNGYSVVYNGSDYELRDISVDGATSLTSLTDFDGNVTPSDGDVITYNETSGLYEPTLLPSTSTESALKKEWIRLNYTTDGSYDSLETSSGITLKQVNDTDLNQITITFDGYNFPPLSIAYYGYKYQSNTYVFRQLGNSVSKREIDALGTNGSPLLFETRDTPSVDMTLSMSTSDTDATPSSDFPPEPTHAYAMFIMGE